MARAQKSSAPKASRTAKRASGFSERQRTRQAAAIREFLKMAGSASSPHRDVSSNKYKHVADSVASKP